MSDHGCRLDLPYPPVEVEGKNLCYAQILLKDFAGKNGEVTAITQYLYQHFLVHQENPTLSQLLACISEVEMRHMDMVGELITLLGALPLYRAIDGCVNAFWTGNYVCPTQNAKKFLTENIAAEKTAIRNYRHHISLIKDRKVQAVLERIILDEEHHIGLFTKALSELPG